MADAKEMEAYVRSKWEVVYDHGGPSYPERPTDGGDRPVGVRIKGVMKDGYFVKFKDMKAAYDFTLQREEEIRRLERDIDFISENFADPFDDGPDPDSVLPHHYTTFEDVLEGSLEKMDESDIKEWVKELYCAASILTRLQAIRAELGKGMKG